MTSRAHTLLEGGAGDKIALFTVSFSHLHYNVIQRGCEALKLQNSPKLPHIHARFHCNANEQSKT